MSVMPSDVLQTLIVMEKIFAVNPNSLHMAQGSFSEKSVLNTFFGVEDCWDNPHNLTNLGHPQPAPLTASNERPFDRGGDGSKIPGDRATNGYGRGDSSTFRTQNRGDVEGGLGPCVVRMGWATERDRPFPRLLFQLGTSIHVPHDGEAQ